MDQLAYFLQTVGYYAVQSYPNLPVYLHLLVSALFPIYAGAHASLSRPSSAAKPSGGIKKRDNDDDEPEEQYQTMEGLGPIDALLLPLFAGLSLSSLYFLIKWLEDPEILNKILNWYFAVFGVWSLARMIRDSMGIFTSFVVPKTCGSNWEMDAEQRKSKRSSSLLVLVEQNLPVSKPFSASTLPSTATNAMSILRELLSRQLDVRVYIHKIVQAQFKISSQGVTSLSFAVVGLLYFNLIDKPWWLTNLLGFGFAYSALQIMSPTTSWTGTLILGVLFIYDIYFVFFTPLMVTVATQLDIPAKLVFPRPSRPTEDPTKPALFMLGLGDIILPGMMIGFALRFDLYLFYLRKQIPRTIKGTEDAANDPATKEAVGSEVTKATWHPATGGWGERFWTPKNDILRSRQFQGVLFPKTYFHASVIGYVLGMLCTLGVMNVYGQAQPALLYLVPGVLGSLWGTALIKGDIKTLWAFDESEDDQDTNSPSKSEKSNRSLKSGSWMDIDWKSLFLFKRISNKSEKLRGSVENNEANNLVGKGDTTGTKGSRSRGNPLEKSKGSGSSHGESTSTESSDDEVRESKKPRASDGGHKEDIAKGIFDRDRKRELIFISVNLAKMAPANSSKMASITAQATSSTHVEDGTRAKPEVEDNDDDGLGETY